MEMGSEIVSGVVALALAFAMLWVARPNKSGESPPFLRPSFMLMIYPVGILMFVVFGVAQFFKAFY